MGRTISIRGLVNEAVEGFDDRRIDRVCGTAGALGRLIERAVLTSSAETPSP